MTGYWEARLRIISSAALALLTLLLVTSADRYFMEPLARNRGMVWLSRAIFDEQPTSALDQAIYYLSQNTDPYNLLFLGLAHFLAKDATRALTIWQAAPEQSVSFLISQGDRVSGHTPKDMFWTFLHIPDEPARLRALTFYELAHTLSPASGSILYRMAVMHHLVGEIELAEQYYRQVLDTKEFTPPETESPWLESHYWLGRIAWEKGDAAAACFHMAEVLRIEPGFEFAQIPFEGWNCGQ